MGLFTFLRYLRLKFLVSSLRILMKLLSPQPAPKPDTILRIPSRDQGRTIKAHIYNPTSNPGSAERSPHPVLINFNGSGFTLPFHGSDDKFCRFIATHTNHIIIDIAYRLAPENPFPAALNDAEDAITYVLSNPSQYQTTHISLSGFSSGGTLALILPSLFPANTFRSLIGFYPSASMAGDPAARKAPVPGKERGAFWTRIFREAYIGDFDARDPRISPVFGGEMEMGRYPGEMLVFTADEDVSATEMEGLAGRIGEEGGGNVVVRRMEGCGHGFDKKKSESQMEAGQVAYAEAAEFLKGLEGESR